MSIQFSDTVNSTGIVQQVRSFLGVDANQWPTYKIVNSANSWLDYVAGFAIASDKRFQWDDTNHTALPIGTTNIVSGQSDYSFLTDQQGNTIVTLTRIDKKDASGNWVKLDVLDETQEDQAIDSVVVSGEPTGYYKLADNIIRLNALPTANVTAGLKFYFQRTPSYFAATDTTKAPGVSPLLHRGFVIAAAYDGAITLGLPSLVGLSNERQKEDQKMVTYFSGRDNDEVGRMSPAVQNNK